MTSIAFVVDGAGAEIFDGITWSCSIDRGYSVSGSITVDIWKDAYTNFLPDDGDSITASARLSITTTTDSQDSALTGFTTSIPAGDILRSNVDSATTIARATISLRCIKP